MLNRTGEIYRNHSGDTLVNFARVFTLQTISRRLVPLVSQPALAQQVLMSTTLARRVPFSQAHSTTESPVRAMISKPG